MTLINLPLPLLSGTGALLDANGASAASSPAIPSTAFLVCSVP